MEIARPGPPGAGFLKTPDTIAGPDDPVTVPRRAEEVDREVELGVVIGRRAQCLDGPCLRPGDVVEVEIDGGPA